MNKYLLEVEHYFGANERFEVEAENKADALVKGQEYMDTRPHFCCGNHKRKTLRVVKKIKK